MADQPDDNDERRLVVTVHLSARQIGQLEERAKRLGLSVTDLASLVIEDFLTFPTEDFTRELDYLMEKNAELYRRLS